MAQGIVSRNPCADFHNNFFVTLSDVRPAPGLLWSASPPAQDRSAATRSIQVAGGKFRACLTIVQMR